MSSGKAVIIPLTIGFIKKNINMHYAKWVNIFPKLF